jgi:hypothetical protein
LGDGITATKRTSSTKTGKSPAATEERKAIEREAFDWGVRLTAHPFKGTENQVMVIRSEIGHHKPGRGCEVRITFPAASMQSPLRLVDAQAWCEAMNAIIADTRAVQAEMRTSAEKAGKNKR